MRAAAGVIFIFEGKGTIVERGPDRACGMRGARKYGGGPEGVGEGIGQQEGGDDRDEGSAVATEM